MTREEVLKEFAEKVREKLLEINELKHNYTQILTKCIFEEEGD